MVVNRVFVGCGDSKEPPHGYTNPEEAGTESSVLLIGDSLELGESGDPSCIVDLCPNIQEEEDTNSLLH